MRSFNKFRLRLRSLLHRDVLDRDMQLEMEFHLQEQRAENERLGMNGADADAAARRLFGSQAALEEECREHRGVRWLDDLWADARFALRSFSRSPVFTAVVVLTLALGIGANAAFFAAAYGILFRPLPFPAPERLVDLENGVAGVGVITSLRELARAVDYAGYLPDEHLTLKQSGDAVRVRAASVTWNLDRVLAAPIERGRWFTASEEMPGRNRVAVLSDRLWRERLGADPSILGRHIELDEQPFEVVGIMPPDFAFPTADTAIWIPIRLETRDVGYFWGDSNLWPIGRLKGGMGIAAAQAELRPAIDQIRKRFPWRMPDAWGSGAAVASHARTLTKETRPKLLALAAASWLLLLIACGNVANLLLARAIQREREFAMREALGARRGRLLRQLLTENLLLVLAGGGTGLLGAAAILRSLPALLPKETPRLDEVSPHASLMPAGALAMLATLVLFSAAPLFRLLRPRREPLSGRAVTASRQLSRVSLSLIAVELALATTLLIGAGLTGRTLWHLSQEESGVQAAGVVTARVSAGPRRCPNREACWALLNGLSHTMISAPGIQGVGWSNMAPLDKQIYAMAVAVQDHPKPAGAPAYVLWQVSATPGYFPILHVPLRAGRLFTDGDQAASAKVMIISASTARRFWPGESAIGKHIQALSDNDWRTVVGVVGDVAQSSLTGFPAWIDGVMYLPLAQSLPRTAQGIELTMLAQIERPQGGSGLAGLDWERTMHARFPDVVISGVTPLEQVRSESFTDQRSTAWLLALFAGLGLALGVAGVYGVISHRVKQRTREIGICMALGASRGRVVGMVLRETVLVALCGIAIGVGAALGLSRFVASLLWGVTVHDPVTLVLCPVILLIAALLAAIAPGARAARMDPSLTLREE